ncbi:MAG: hypothetical protein KGH61_00500 [Candidatus Micrarchaeota archaeon]|nr:hypothetical protein [Candidatus Micrarchaeota archaeon]MDE1847416.1 hypothetical protein [Candidatus Micrarchaeota archaeon]MDE1864089.1 hypothetical protein [Candidatus Micrarchaeota archaeon]
MPILAYFRAFFTSKWVIATTAVFAIAYYFMINYVISLNAPAGFVIITTPPILIYLLALSAAVLISISIESIRLSLSRIRNESTGALSVLTMLAGGVIAGCNCEVPVLSSILYLLALNGTAVSSIIAIVGDYQNYIFVLLIVLNVALSYYSLSRLFGSCSIQKGRIVRKKR